MPKQSVKNRQLAERTYQRRQRQATDEEIDDKALKEELQEALYSCGRQAARGAGQICKSVAQGTAATAKCVCSVSPKKVGQAIGISIAASLVGAILADSPSDASHGVSAHTRNGGNSSAVTAAVTCVAVCGIVGCACDYWARITRPREAASPSLEEYPTGDEGSMVETQSST